MFRRRHGVCPRRIEHEHTAARSRFNIDIIHSNSRPANNTQSLRRIENFRGDLRLATHNHSVHVSDELENFGFGEPGADGDF